jgi:hypothetical protein
MKIVIGNAPFFRYTEVAFTSSNMEEGIRNLPSDEYRPFIKENMLNNESMRRRGIPPAPGQGDFGNFDEYGTDYDDDDNNADAKDCASRLDFSEQ